jgi:hypothetical protein
MSIELTQFQLPQAVQNCLGSLLIGLIISYLDKFIGSGKRFPLWKPIPEANGDISLTEKMLTSV